MGHEIKHITYKENVNKKEVQSYWNDYASKAGWQEGSSGLPSDIRWIEDKVLPSYEDAMEYIKIIDNGWYDQIAVKYKHYNGLIKKTQTHQALEDRYMRLRNRYNELSSKTHYEGCKSKFISCKSCESKINSAYFGQRVYNFCPICKADLRPDTTLQLIKNAYDNYLKAEKELREEDKKARKKYESHAETRWLVKIEYHV